MTTKVDDMSGELLAKLTLLANTIKDIENDSPEISHIIMQSYSLALRTIQQMEHINDPRKVGLEAQLEFITNALGFNLEDIILHVVEKQFPPGESVLLDGRFVPGRSSQIAPTKEKEVDSATLDFITSTSDLDDYEKFLAQAKAKESIDFLKKQI